MKVLQTYAITSSHDDEEREQFYQDVELAMRKVQTHYTVVMGDFNHTYLKQRRKTQTRKNTGRALVLCSFLSVFFGAVLIMYDQYQLARTQTLLSDFNAKVGKKQAGEQAIGNYGIDSRNARGEMLVELAERNRARIMSTFFRKCSNRKWTWKSPNGETRNEINFILPADPRIV